MFLNAIARESIGLKPLGAIADFKDSFYLELVVYKTEAMLKKMS